MLALQVRVDPAPEREYRPRRSRLRRKRVRPFVQYFLTAAAETLDLQGPVAVIRSERCAGDTSAWARRRFDGQFLLDCRLAARTSVNSELTFEGMPIELDSLRTLLCVDLLCRFDETAEFLRLAMPLAKPCGLVLLTADVRGTRPQMGLSRVLTPLGLERLAADLDGAIVGWTGDVDFPDSMLLVACRSPVCSDFGARARLLIETFQTDAQSAARVSWPALMWRLLSPWRGQPRAAAEARSAAQTNFSLRLPRAANWKEALLDSSCAEKQSISRLDTR
jgi:hypothetical protein